METLAMNQMEQIEGGNACEETAKFRSVVGGIATVGSFAGPIGAAIFGPTTVVLGAAAIACAYD
jgi:uncharacterized protein YaaW (UPF0174 family)